MNEAECKVLLVKQEQGASLDSIKQDDNEHDWWASDSGSSAGSYYSDTGSSIVEWESEIGPTGEVFYIESPVENVTSTHKPFFEKNDSQPDLIRRRSTRAGKLMRFIRRKDSKRWSTRNKRAIINTMENKGGQEKEGNGNKVTFRDFQTGEIREATLWVDPERRHKLGRRATLCEAYFGITPGCFSDKLRIMVAGFIPDGEAMKNKNIKIGDWLRSINSTDVTFQNLDCILSDITIPTNIVTLQLQRVSGIDVTAKAAEVDNSKQSTLVKQLVNKEESKCFMESLLDYPLGVIYLQTVDLTETEQELQGVIYTFPRSDTKKGHSTLCSTRGAFITLNHLLPEIVGPRPISTTVSIAGEEMHVVYVPRDQELLLIALPERCCDLQEAVMLSADVVRVLEFIYQSLTKCFTNKEHHDYIDHFLSLIMQRLLDVTNLKNSPATIKDDVKLQNNIANFQNYKFRSAFSVANFINLPRDAQIQIDAALNEMEAMDYRDWNEDPMDCQRIYTILGSCLYHKCYLLGSHLSPEDLMDIHAFLRQNGLLSLVNNEPVKSLIIWKRIYPLSCNRGVIDNTAHIQPLVPNGKWFLLIVGYGHDLLAVLLESGGCTGKYNSTIGPDVFYVEEAQETLKHIQKIGITTLAAKWIASNARPEIIPYDECITTKQSSSITENLLGLIKSSDVQNVLCKTNVTPSMNKKTQELASILKKRNLEESPIILGSVYSLQTSEDSLSQGTGAISEISDEAIPILGRRATREKISSTSRYSDDSDSDIDIYKNESQVITTNISNIRENLLNQVEYLVPNKLTTGNKNYLYHYAHLDMVEGLLLSSNFIENSYKDNKLFLNFNKCIHVIHRLLHNTIRFKKMINQDMDKTVINKSLIAIKEHGILFEWENIAYWIVGCLYTSPHPKELYVCYQDSAPQNLVEITFKLNQ